MKSLSYSLIVLLLVSCGQKATEEKQQGAATSIVVVLTAKQLQTIHYETAIPQQRELGITIFANGKIEVPPQNKTIISAKFGGFVKSLRVLDGMAVRKGQVLLTLEHPDLIQLQQDFLEVESSMDYLQAEDERQRLLVEQDATTKKNYQLAHANYLAALAKRSGLKSKLELAGISIAGVSAGNIQRSVSIVAPFDGVVTKINTEVGGFAQPSDKLLEIIDLKHAHAEVIVFEKDVQYLAVGQPVTPNFAHGTDPLTASIFLIGKEISADRSIKVHCHLNKENAALPPGSYFKASIKAGMKAVYCIPSTAVVNLNGKDVVFVERARGNGSKAFIPEEVQVLLTEGEFCGISFLNPQVGYSTPIVTTGAYDILSELIIRSQIEE